MVVSAEHQHDPGAGADAADADDLAGHVDQPELLQQHAPIGLQRLSVAPQKLVQPRSRWLLASRPVRQVVDPIDQRRVGHDLRLTVDHPGQLRERGHAVARPRLRDRLFDALLAVRFFSWLRS